MKELTCPASTSGRSTCGRSTRGPVTLTEKVDGTNARIVGLPGGAYLIGSREELLYARGDLIGNPALGIVDALRDVAERLSVAAADDRRRSAVPRRGGPRRAGRRADERVDRRVGRRTGVAPASAVPHSDLDNYS
ncbi:hypothetical protein ACIBVK_20520 [Micromonospora echinofusca]|uniref:hypothetical protein n=1 Tax=Micromonospora echinofusca TaxID=47858 RepID=UPI0037BD6766